MKQIQNWKDPRFLNGNGGLFTHGTEEGHGYGDGHLQGNGHGVGTGNGSQEGYGHYGNSKYRIEKIDYPYQLIRYEKS